MRRDTLLTILSTGFFLLLLSAFAGAAAAQEVTIPTLQIGVGATNDPAQVSIAIQVLLLLTVLALAPSILVLMTSLPGWSLSSTFFVRRSAPSPCRPIRYWWA